MPTVSGFSQEIPGDWSGHDSVGSETAPNTKKRGAIIGICAAIVVALTVAGISLMTRGGGEPNVAATSPSASATPTKSPIGGKARPAPAGSVAVSGGYFMMPSSNIICRIAEKTVDCEIRVADYAKPESNGAMCSMYGWGNLVTLTSGEKAMFSCERDPVFGGSPDPTEFEYGTSIHTKSIACTSSKEGVECWDVKNSAGFQLSRYNQEFT